MTTDIGWTEEQVAKITVLWKAGLPASRIADQLGRGFTRNMVIGKLYRLGLSRRQPTERYSDEHLPRRQRQAMVRGVPSLAPIFTTRRP